MVAPFARPRRAVKPNAAQRRAEGAGLDGEGADRAIIRVAAMCVYLTLSERSSTNFYK
jgi:hypothetical protein